MGKGPGTIYNDCMAKAIRMDKALANDKKLTDMLGEFNLKFGCCCLFEKDIRLEFFNENYSAKTTERAIKQWADLHLVTRIPYKGYSLILFNETLTRIKEGA